ncbi:MAG: AIM24 family protein [Clostridiales bacterium]|nr:AIM24 family protein [Clostridiales bacterium]
MITSIDFENKLIMKAEMENDSTFQVLEFEKLRGATDVETAIGLDAINRNNMKLKQVRILLDGNAIKLEPGALSYMKGEITKKNAGKSVLNLGKRIINNKINREIEDEKPIYQGSGEIFLEPSFGNFVLIELEDETIIVDDGLFIACEEVIDIKINTVGRKNEIKLSGSGIIVLEMPVAEEEIFKCKLYNHTLKVDGDFAVLRGGNVECNVETLTDVSGSETINVYTGIGDVWLLPTKNIYEDIKKNLSVNEFSDDEGC